MESAGGPNGRVIVRRYRLQERIGQGGMGTVWRAYDELLGRTIAIKEVNLPHLAEIDQAEMRERAMREARAAARLSHPNTITVHDVVQEDGNPWIVMTLIDADSLAEVLRKEGPLPPTRVAEIGLAVLSALEEAHAAGILHRDVKPGNVLLGTRGRIVLTDFGIATLEGDPAMTTAGLLLGAPAYMAPERVAGLELGPSSDLWSLGATLYAAVEGRPPYDRQSAMATLSALMSEDLPVPQSAGRLTSTLLGLLVRDPAHRLGATACRRELEQALRDPNEHGTRFLPAFAGEPLGGSRNGERTQVVARPGSGGRPAPRHQRADDTRVVAGPHPHATRVLGSPAPAAAAGSAAAGPAVPGAPAEPLSRTAAATVGQPPAPPAGSPPAKAQTAAPAATAAPTASPANAKSESALSPSTTPPEPAKTAKPAKPGSRPATRWWAFRVSTIVTLMTTAIVAATANPWLADLVARRKRVIPSYRPISQNFYEQINFPAWVVPDPPTQSLQTSLAYDSRALLFVVLVGVLLYRLLRFLRVRRGRLVVFLIAWCAVIVAAALAGVLASSLVNGVLGGGVTDPANPVVEFALQQAGKGARYGVVVGWLPALFAVLVAGRRRARRSQSTSGASPQ